MMVFVVVFGVFYVFMFFYLIVYIFIYLYLLCCFMWVFVRRSKNEIRRVEMRR